VLLPLLAATTLLALGSVIGGAAYAVSGAAYTTTNQSPAPGGDGPGTCKNGNPGVNCNIYGSKAWVWTNGGPSTNKLLPTGQYFFAVLAPGGQNAPNDGGHNNLSDDYDTYHNRTFTVSNGNISAYAGTHSFDVDETDDGEPKIRLYPYADTTNPGGVYILAMCYLGNGYPVAPTDCKYDAFKVPEDDRTPPECPEPTFGPNAAGQHTATAVFRDPGGLDSLTVIDMVNVSTAVTNFYLGTTQPVTLKAAKIDQAQASRVVVQVRDVAGNVNTCDPVLANLKLSRGGSTRQVFKDLSAHEDLVRIKNGRPGLSRFVVSVNGRRFTVKLKAGQSARVRIGSALRATGNNTVTLSGYGKAGGRAAAIISN
jgi:hypothetical protein